MVVNELTPEDLLRSLTEDVPVVRRKDLPQPAPYVPAPVDAELSAWLEQEKARQAGQSRACNAQRPPVAAQLAQPVAEPAKAMSPTELKVRDRVEALQIDAEARRRVKSESEGESEGLAFLNVAELDSLPTPDPLIESVLNRHTYSLLRGRDGTFKSFIALDWALHLATGRSWQGRATQKTRVLYIAAEGAYGMRARVDAWQDAHGPVEPDQFVLVPQPVNMYAPGHAFDQLLARVPEFGLVIVDTLRRVSGGADENGSDMGMVVDSLNTIKAATKEGSVLVVAHTQKSDGDVRGFSGIEDDADGVWHAQRDEGSSHVKLTCKKAKDGPDGHSHDLLLKARRSSLVVADLDIASLGALVGDSPDEKIMDTMRRLFADTGATTTELISESGVSRTVVYEARARLLKTGQLELQGQRLQIGLKTGQSGPVRAESGDQSGAVRGVSERESGPIRAKSGAVSRGGPPSKGGPPDRTDERTDRGSDLEGKNLEGATPDEAPGAGGSQ